MGIIFHIDVNSAFLSWTAVKMLEEGSRVDIRKIPSIIGGDKEKRHGIVLAKSESAKKFGIVTGEPIVNALKKCPSIEICPPEHGYYSECSHKLMTLLREYTDEIEQASIDECYMDYSGISHRFNSPLEAAKEISSRVYNELKFTVNIGISDVKVLAKMASDFEKPNKIHTLYKDEIKEKMWPLKISDLFMAGKSSVVTLNKLGINTIGQLALAPPNIIEAHLKSHGRMLHNFANGIDESIVKVERDELKGVGNSTTVSYDLDDIEEIKKVLLWLAGKVGRRLRDKFQKAGTVCVEIKYNDFTKTSKQIKLDGYTDSDTEIYNIACMLFEELWNMTPVRLLGIRTTGLENRDEPEQMSFFDLNGNAKEEVKVKNAVNHDKLKKLDAALDKIKEKYGDDAVGRASLMQSKGEIDEGKKR